MAGNSGNGFLDALQQRERTAILSSTVRVVLESRQVIYEPTGDRFGHIYFPIDCLISVIRVQKDGAMPEVSSIGRNGLTGSRFILGLDRPTLTGICTVPGEAYRVPLSTMTKVARQSRAARDKVLRYTAAVAAVAGQRAVCNRFHEPEERLARWLLVADDSVQRNSVEITHSLLGQLEGLMRPAVSAALGALKRRGAIDVERGRIVIRSRPKLKACSCECYEIIRSEFGQV